MSATEIAVDDVDEVETVERRPRRPPSVVRVAFRMWRTRIGLIITLAMVLIAFFGRYFAPYGEKEGIGVAMKPASELDVPSMFGTGELGLDIWTRFLYGGRPILITAVLATAFALVFGTIIGLIAAYNRGKLDDVLMRAMDVILAFPQIILALLVISMFGATNTLIVFTVGASTVPRIARVVRGSAVSVVERDFVSAAEALGESRQRILRSELLPNVSAPLLVEANLRLTFSIGVIAGIAFLGFAADPGAANWGLMINENRGGLLGKQPWGVILPVIAIALLTIGTGLIGDGLSRASAGVDRTRGDAWSALTIRDLRIEVGATGDDIVAEINLSIASGEVLGLVGESGSGKTTVGLSVLGHSRRGVKLAGGSVEIGTASMLSLDDRALRAARGTLVSYVPQDPSTALNPALRIGKQLLEVMEFHGFGGTAEARRARAVEVLSELLLPGTPDFQRRYPHQLSGGQQQRVGLAMAFACRPSVIVLDEPTTGLDVSTQAFVLATVRDLTRRHGVAALYVTHDLAVVANLADRVAVMYAGRIVEEGPTRTIFEAPSHPYTRYLTAAAPDISGDQAIVGLRGRAPSPGKRPVGCAFALRCELAVDACREAFPAVTEVSPGHNVRCIRPGEIPARTRGQGIVFAAAEAADSALSLRKVSASYTRHAVVHDVSLDVGRGECVALVGESGSGKSTLSRSIGGLHREWSGDILLNGQPLRPSSRDRPTAQRLSIQYVFQNPYSSLHPRRSVGDSVARPLRIAGVGKDDARRAVDEMLERVSLTSAFAAFYPDQLSGGERQRVAIARALVSRPSVLICDEVTSALDVLVQAAVIELLVELQHDLGLAMLFVTHNLPLVRSLAQRVAVMADGKIVEFGFTEQVLTNPDQEYTKRLLADTPSISTTIFTP